MSTIIFNKKTVPSNQPCINYNDRGFTLGHGLFETILIKNNASPALDYHWTRLKTSALIIGIEIPFSYQELKSMLSELIKENNLENKIAGARVTVTHGDSERGILPAQPPQPNFLISVFECAKPIDRPFSALIANTRKNEQSAASRVKSISYLDNILARREAMEQGYDEALLLNTASNVADGSIFNVYMVKDGQIYTPPIVDGALPGVMRAILITEYINQCPIIEKSITPQELMAADEVFLTNALMGVKSVNRINTREFDSFACANKVDELLA